MRRGAVLMVVLVGLCAAGCGLFQSVGSETAGQEEAPLSISEVAGGRVVALRRPTPGLVHVALWIDAGSRDAEPPQLATVAAWMAAERAGDSVHPRVLPDGTAFSMMCHASELAACVERLGRALSAREVDAATVARLRNRLADARRRAAGDEGRTADGLALESLLGEGAAGLAPFGRSAGDEAVTPDAVQRFFAAHYGPRRTMIVAAGDVSAEPLGEAAKGVLERSPAATASRDARSLSVLADAPPRVEVGEAAIVSVATAFPDLGAAAAVARQLAVLEASRRPVVHAFELRGGAVLVARVRDADPEAATGALAYAIRRAVLEQPGGAAPELHDDPVAAAQGLGMRWIAEGPARAGSSAAGAPDEDGDEDGNAASPPLSHTVAVGAVVPGGRGDARADDPDRALREGTQEALVQARARAVALVEPRTRGSVTATAASVVADNGARIDVRRRRGDRRVAVAVRLAGGAAFDPAPLHGRATLLAVLAAEVCPALGPGGLAARLGAIDGIASPRVGGGSWGLVLHAPGDRWAEAIDLALLCALTGTPDRGDVERARLLLLDRLEGGPELAAWAARAIAPGAPGRVAPLGAPASVREISAADVRRERAEAVAGARISVAVVGEVPVEEALRRVARRVARLPRGAAAPRAPATRSEPPEGPLAADWDGTRPRVVVAWQAGAQGADADAAHAFAEATAAVLARSAGVVPVWWDGGAEPGEAWAAVALDVTEEALASLPDTVRAAAGAVGAGDLERIGARRAQARARADAQPASLAERIARQRLSSRVPGDATRTAAALREAPAHFVIGRRN